MSIESVSPVDYAAKQAERAAQMAFEREHHPDDIDAYYEEKVAQVLRGDLVWMVRNVDADYGRVYDLFYKGRFVGLLEHEYGIDSVGYTQAALDDASVDIIPGSFMEVVEKLETFAKHS